MASVSFATDILPMFRRIDIDHMGRMGIKLDDYAYMSDPAGDHQHARSVFDSVSGKAQPQMPPGGPYWDKTQLDTFAQWMTDGYNP